MCGVVGYIGAGQVQAELIKGLEKLEYRGYDSAGIYIMDHEHQGHYREVGRIANLKETVDFNMPAKVGIGHTRWATHGPATQYNAHPHLSASGRFALVHNGVIENYAALKSDFLSHVDFKSDTDTEVAVNLIAYFAEEEGLETEIALRKALHHIHGSFAFALIDSQNPDLLYAAKNKSPLLVGLGQGFNLICSDAMAGIHLTPQYLEIKDQEYVVLTESDVTIKDFDGKKVDRPPFTAELDAADLEKGTYPHFMIKEIDEQPTVIRRLISQYTDEKGQVALDPNIVEATSQADRIYIVACGTSYHAGCVGKGLIEKFAGIPVEVHLASEFAYDLPMMSQQPLFIFITQSGETADSRQALVKVNELGYPSLTITNVKGSTLSREASHTLLLHAGPEIAVASTKAYTAQIAALALLAEAMRVYLGKEQGFDLIQTLSLIAAEMESILSNKDKIQAWVDHNLLETPNAFYIGRLADYAVSMEAALKLKEISYIQTEAFAAGELKHGTIALIEEGTPVMAIITDPSVASHTRGNVEEVKARGAKTMVIATQDCAQADDFYVLPALPALLTPLATVVITQLIAYYTTLGKGLDVDKPRNLAKSVTVE
ncbi:TPA: glutamine--fructose-6-phosphate transaminase (isomerizing) [Streptococcus suis]